MHPLCIHHISDTQEPYDFTEHVSPRATAKQWAASAIRFEPVKINHSLETTMQQERGCTIQVRDIRNECLLGLRGLSAETFEMVGVQDRAARKEEEGWSWKCQALMYGTCYSHAFIWLSF